MAELIPTLYELMGELPPRGQEFWDAVTVSQVSDAGTAAKGAAALEAAVGPAALAQATAGRGPAADARLVGLAHRELGLTNVMTWAVNSSSIFVFRASDRARSPKHLSARHPLKQVTFTDVIPERNNQATIEITIFDLPVRARGTAVDVERFATNLQQAIGQLL